MLKRDKTSKMLLVKNYLLLSDFLEIDLENFLAKISFKKAEDKIEGVRSVEFYFPENSGMFQRIGL